MAHGAGPVIWSIRGPNHLPYTFAHGARVPGTDMDDEFCRERARTVRALAERADPLIKRRLLQLASHYERRIAGPSDIRGNQAPAVSGPSQGACGQEVEQSTERPDLDRQ